MLDALRDLVVNFEEILHGTRPFRGPVAALTAPHTSGNFLGKRLRAMEILQSYLKFEAEKNSEGHQCNLRQLRGGKIRVYKSLVYNFVPAGLMVLYL